MFVLREFDNKIRLLRLVFLYVLSEIGSGLFAPRKFLG